MGTSVRVKSTARLAMCLIDMNGEGGRVDGCVGFSIKNPHIELIASFTNQNNIELVNIEQDVSQHDQIIKLVEKVRQIHQINKGIKIEIIRNYQSHSGLGSGTQLKLCIAAAIHKLNEQSYNNIELAREVERGGTSGIGTWTFEKGGFIVDGGHSFGIGAEKQSFLPSSKSYCAPPPLICRHDFPNDWRIICLNPYSDTKLYGIDEYKMFIENCPVSKSEVQQLSWTILMKMLPAIVNTNLIEFNSAVEEIQNLAFKKIVWKYQPQNVKKVKALMASEGLHGLGLSSLGNTLFSVVEKQDLPLLEKRIQRALSKENLDCSFWVTSGNNQGASINYE